jgi:hypothetical protein
MVHCGSPSGGQEQQQQQQLATTAAQGPCLGNVLEAWVAAGLLLPTCTEYFHPPAWQHVPYQAECSPRESVADKACDAALAAAVNPSCPPGRVARPPESGAPGSRRAPRNPRRMIYRSSATRHGWSMYGVVVKTVRIDSSRRIERVLARSSSSGAHATMLCFSSVRAALLRTSWTASTADLARS